MGFEEFVEVGIDILKSSCNQVLREGVDKKILFADMSTNGGRGDKTA